MLWWCRIPSFITTSCLYISFVHFAFKLPYIILGLYSTKIMINFIRLASMWTSCCYYSLPVVSPDLTTIKHLWDTIDYQIVYLWFLYSAGPLSCVCVLLYNYCSRYFLRGWCEQCASKLLFHFLKSETMILPLIAYDCEKITCTNSQYFTIKRNKMHLSYKKDIRFVLENHFKWQGSIIVNGNI